MKTALSAGPLAVATATASTWLVIPLATLCIAFTSTTGGTLAAALASSGCGPGGGSGGGQVTGTDGSYNAEQMTIARTVVATTAHRQLPKRAAVVAVAAAIVESELRNLDYGDRDSLGVFQQRPSQGWGTRAQLLNPVYATNAFLDRLVTIDGWQHMPDGMAEQLVQRSGFPERYAPQHPRAEAIVAKFWRGPDNPTPPRAGTDRRAADSPAGRRGGVTIVTGCPDTDTGDTTLKASDRKKLPPGFTLPRDRYQRAAVAYVASKLGAPYVWGAKGPDSFDCSGLLMAAWAHAGVAIGAATTTQIHDGHPVPTLARVRPGDLLFIPGSLGTPANPRHVGMYIGHGLLINAYDQNTGVVLEQLDAWRDQIVAIRRVHTPTADTPGEA